MKTVRPRPPSYQEFDQTPGQGWRYFADLKQYLKAAEVIQAYINLKSYDNSEACNLHFHAAQMYAFDNNLALAILHARNSLDQGLELDDSAKGWNAYVNATLAFLSNDKPRLSTACAYLEQHQDFKVTLLDGTSLYPNKINLAVVNRMIAGLEQSLSYATVYLGANHADEKTLLNRRARL